MNSVNTLKDQFLSVLTLSGRTRTYSLPEMFALAMADEIASMPGMRPHQRAAMHAFLVQLGCIACERASLDRPPGGADDWYRILTALTPDWPEGEPWNLVASEADKPALFQPPQPPDAPPLKNVIRHPDQLDLLVTSKNHDLKRQLMGAPDAEDWFFALLSLQTQEGYGGGGGGKRGIARMNSGFGNRSYLTLAPEAAGFGGRVRRDIEAILSDLDAFYETSPGIPGGHTLLWLHSWAGTESFLLDECHPLFVEICRRIRLVEKDGRIEAAEGLSKVARVDANEYRGNVGDPWLPLNTEGEVKAMTLAADGFSYRRMAQLIGGAGDRYRLPFLARPTHSERSETLAFEAYGLVRGQGKTEGFHERRVVVPPKASSLFSEPTGRERLAARSKAFLDLAAACSRRVLRMALIQLFQGRSEIEWNKPSNDSLCHPWLERLDRQVDQSFFPLLFRTLDQSDEDAEREISQMLVNAARNLLEDAASGPAGHAERQELARARAELVFERASRKHLPALRPIHKPDKAMEHELES